MVENLTELELKVFECIPKDCFYEYGVDSILWIDAFLDTVQDETGINSKVSRAIISNLKKKQLIMTSKEAFELTDKSKEYFKSRGF